MALLSEYTFKRTTQCPKQGQASGRPFFFHGGGYCIRHPNTYMY